VLKLLADDFAGSTEDKKFGIFKIKTEKNMKVKCNKYLKRGFSTPKSSIAGIR